MLLTLRLLLLLVLCVSLLGGAAAGLIISHAIVIIAMLQACIVRRHGDKATTVTQSGLPHPFWKGQAANAGTGRKSKRKEGKEKASRRAAWLGIVDCA